MTISKSVLSRILDGACREDIFSRGNDGSLRFKFDRIDVVMNGYVPTLEFYYRGAHVSTTGLGRCVGPYDTVTIHGIEGSSRVTITAD